MTGEFYQDEMSYADTEEIYSSSTDNMSYDELDEDCGVTRVCRDRQRGN